MLQRERQISISKGPGAGGAWAEVFSVVGHKRRGQAVRLEREVGLGTWPGLGLACGAAREGLSGGGSTV